MNYKQISYSIENSICYIGFGVNEKKSMITLGEESLKEFKTALQDLTQNAKKSKLQGLIIFSHKDNCFIAGADIKLISSINSENDGTRGAENGQTIYNLLEDLPIPSVACVHGVCLGGGMELALACTSIIASDSPKTKLGLPEVQLGLIPGFGGTYRLPKKVGLPNALDLILSGRQVNAKKALRMGLINEIYPKERLQVFAPKFFKSKKRSFNIKSGLENLAQENFVTRKLIFQKARESVLKKTKGFYQAPLKILEVMEAGAGKKRNAYLAIEATAFGELSISNQSKNLQHIFFMTDDTKKRGKEIAANVDIKRGAVLGAGTMGGGIAWLFANNNQVVSLKDLNIEALELGLNQSEKNFAPALKRRRLTGDDFERKQRSILPTLNFDGFKKTNLLVEAIVENIEVKKKVFTELEQYVDDKCIITSNTSSLSINEMSKALKKSDRFAGLHFFNPVNKMPLVEIITHDNIASETTDFLYKWILKVKKIPIVVKDGPGFLVNRILAPWLNEAAFLLEEGLPIGELDQACVNFGMPMGPARLFDEIGLDIVEKVGISMHKSLGKRMKPSKINSQMVKTGCLGRKNSKGLYLYNGDGKVEGENPEINDLLPSKKITMEETTIQMRLFLPMINEAAMILSEGIVADAASVDLGMIYGLGFPPFRGGLLKYADFEGLDRILNAIQRFTSSVSKIRYQPCDYLQTKVSENKNFYSCK